MNDIGSVAKTAHHGIDYPFGTHPGDAAAIEIRPGLLWHRMPIRMGNLGHINSYLIEDDDGWTMIDAGYGGAPNQELWERFFTAHLKGKPVVRLICTHSHPDHIGLAPWMCDRWGIGVTMTLAEWIFGRMMALESGGKIHDNVLDYFKKMGSPDSELEEIASFGHNPHFGGIPPMPSSFTRIEGGDVFRLGGEDWTVLIGRGHSHEHACLYSEALGILIGGDIVLPKISPHIGSFATEPEGDPLKQFVSTVKAFRKLPAATLVLPSHNDVFTGLHNQLDYYLDHHDRRIEAILAACETEQTVMSLVPVLFKGDLSKLARRLGVTEALAHCNHLMAGGLMTRRLNDAGQWLFRRADK